MLSQSKQWRWSACVLAAWMPTGALRADTVRGPRAGAPTLRACAEAIGGLGADRTADIESRFGGSVVATLGGGTAGEVLLLRRPDGKYVTVKVGGVGLEREYTALRNISERLRRRGMTVPFPELGEFDAALNAFSTKAISSHDLTGRQPFVAPRSLARLLDDSPALFGPGREAFIGILERGLRDAVRRVHAAGYVHRDIKPENVLITQDAEGRVRVWLVDFDIALPEGDAPPGRAVEGSRGYRAPEQERGERARFDHDWYSVDRVLEDLRSGRRR